tara:strand:+ start:3023 stop:3730 length:708 start_codon:yes stop_codon:yes gene_type:complete
MADINPFANLTPDKALQQQAVNSGNNLANMQRALAQQQMSNRGAMNRTNATNTAKMKVAGINQMLPLVAQNGNTNDPKTIEAMTSMFGANRALKLGQAANQLRSGGYSVADPTQEFTIKQFPELPLLGGFDTKAEAAARAATTLDTKNDVEELVVNGKPVGIKKVKRSRGIKSKNTPDTNSASNIQGQQQLAGLVAEITKDNPYFKGKSVTDVKRRGPKNKLSGRVDGVLMYLDP